MNPEEGSSPTGAQPLLKRLVGVFFFPGEVFRGLREDPRWFGVLLAGALLAALAVILVPAEVWTQAMQEQARARGAEVPAFMESAGATFRLVSSLSSLIFFFLWAFIMAGIVTLTFSFFFGDEGRYVQYLSVVAHGLFLSAVGTFLLLPLRISQADAQLNLSVGTFFFFLDEGYLFRVLKLLDLFGLWGYIVMAIGVTKVDPRRGMGSAVSFFVGFAMVFALIFGSFGG